MDLVDEQHLPRVEVGQDAGQVARFLEHRSGRRPHGDAKLVRDDMSQRGLAQARRTVHQDVVERLVPLSRRRNRHRQVLAQPVLADVLGQRPRPEPGLVLDVFVHPGPSDDPRRGQFAHRCLT